MSLPPENYADADSLDVGGRKAKTLSQRLVVGTSWIMAGRVLSNVALLASNALLSRRLTVPEFGTYMLASFLMPFFAVLATWGAQEILMREVRTSLVHGKARRARQAILSCLVICAANSVATGMGLYLVFWAWQPERSTWAALHDQIVLVALWLFFQTMGQVASEACRGCGKFGWCVALYTKSGGWATNALAAVLIFAFWPHAVHADFTQVMILQVVASALPAFAGLASLFRNLESTFEVEEHEVTGGEEAHDADLPEPTVWWMVGQSWPLLISYSVITGIEQLDILVVGLVASDSALADYAVAKRFLSVINFAFVSLAPAITPFVGELYQKRDLPRMQKLLQGAATVIAVPTVAMCLVLFLFAEPILSLFDPQRVGAAGMLRVQLLGQVMLSLAGHSYLALAMTGHQKKLMHCSLIVGIIYVIIGPPATIMWGGVGAGAAKSLAAAARAIMAAIIVHRTLGIWTTATLSPAAISSSCQLAFNRVRKSLGLRPKS